jgi:hypothetical protein
MPIYYQCGLSYKIPGPKGKLLKVSEELLVDAITYGEAETRMHKLIEERPDAQEWKVKKIAVAKVSEVFKILTIVEGKDALDGESFFKLRVEYLTFDEKTQKEKRVPYTMYINADDPKQAIERLKQELGQVQDYEIVSSIKTKVVDVLDYKPQELSQITFVN